MSIPVTGAAPGERAAAEAIRCQAEHLAGVPEVGRILNALPAMAALLNAQRQAVLVTEPLAQFAGARTPEELQGLRLGEMLGCVHSEETASGCGTTESCGVCGALQAIQLAQLRQGDRSLCRMRRQTAAGEEALDLDVWASPVELAGERFTLVALTDASARGRRDWLAGSLLPRARELSLEIEALAAALAVPSAQPPGLGAGLLVAAARRLSSILQEESDLAAAEAGSLVAVRRPAPTAAVLAAAAAGLDRAPGAVLDPAREELTVDTDPDLLARVLARLLANALEAAPDGPVTLGCRRAGRFADLSVSNPGRIPPAAAMQIFQRGFSTRGPGRGYGTYLARLVAERFLGGRVRFQSEEETTFIVSVPLAGVPEEEL